MGQDTSEPIRRSRKAAVEDALSRGFEPPSKNLRSNGAAHEAARLLNIPVQTIHGWIQTEMRLQKSGKKHFLPKWETYKAREFHQAPEPIYKPPPAYTSSEKALVLTSRKDNTFCFGAAGDLHAGSKYTRWDVRHDLYRQFIEAGAQCNFDTGNWIDGEAPFNRYDIDAHGLESQCQLLAREHPTGLKTHAVWGDDHEGWYVQREGIDVGRYNEGVMKDAGHDWENLGFMEAHVVLRNANSGAEASMAVVHPGGGSAYATSYSIQKIIESLEGGEKPAVGLYGHYHKLWSGLIRNVFVAQTGCQQDQTPFMRKKRLEAHVGGTLIKMKQDPRSGAITSFSAELIRYFNKGWYAGSGRWSKHSRPRMLPRVKTGG
jgi:hypothetical protein